MVIILTTIAAVLLNDNLDSIPIVTPEDGIVTGKNIPSYTNSWEMTAVYPDDSVAHRGTWNDKVSFFLRDGKEMLKREQRIEYPNRVAIQEEEVFRNTLKHSHLVIHDQGKDPHTEINYENHRIWGKKIFRVEGHDGIEQISMPFSYEPPKQVFDWHLWGILIAGFPLKEGYAAKFLAHESYSYLPGDFRWYTLTVTGQEIIDGGKWGKVNCWTVEVDAEVKWKLWIAIDKDIAPVQQICIYDTDGVEYWWKPLKVKNDKAHISIIQAPSNLGLIEPSAGKEPGVKKLPNWLRRHGLYDRLGVDRVVEVNPPTYSMHYDEISGVRNADKIVDYSKLLSKIIMQEVGSSDFPIVIGGDCSIIIGCGLALKSMGNYGLFFIDGHTDFVIPHQSLTKGAAGMDLSIVTGYGHRKLSNIDGLKPYISENVALAFGNRYMDKEYVSNIENSSLRYFDLEKVRTQGIEKIVGDFLTTMRKMKTDGFWIHLDVDVLDDNIMPCVDSRQPGGLTYKELKQTLKLLMNSGLVVGIDITILDPDLDTDGVYTRQFITEFCEIFNNEGKISKK